MADRALTRQQSPAPVTDANPEVEPDLEEMPQARLTRRHWILFGLFVLVAVGFLYFVLPQIAGLEETWDRVNDGDRYWLGAAVLLEGCAWFCFMLLFRTVFVRGDSRIDWGESAQITLAALAANRLFNAAGAGGIALTAWALRRSGMERRAVACRMVAFLVLLYCVYMVALVVFGIGLRTGVLHGGDAFAITVVPAIVGAVAIAIFLGVSLLPADFERLVARWSEDRRRPWVARLARRLATVPASTASGVRTAIALVRGRRWGVLGAVGWWAFDIGVLWACFHAFSVETPPLGVVVMGYFVGMLGNLLPLPGGIGGVEGGMIGAFIALGEPAGLAVVAVLAYRAFAFWLPTIPGAVAYFQLRRTVNRWREEEAPAGAAPA